MNHLKELSVLATATRVLNVTAAQGSIHRNDKRLKLIEKRPKMGKKVSMLLFDGKRGGLKYQKIKKGKILYTLLPVAVERLIAVGCGHEH